MENLKKHLSSAVFALALATSVSAADAATYTFVGSWAVDDGPFWFVGTPIAYSGQEAAAFLFGGAAASYAISTVDSLVANIDFQAWVSTWGGACSSVFPCGTQVAENSVVSTGGNYLNPGDTSAFVRDWAIGAQYTNYAFRVSTVPLPAALPLLLVALGGLGIAGRRRKSRAA
jgi:hypothetical protein